MIRNIKESDVPKLSQMIVDYWHEFKTVDQDKEIEAAAAGQFSRFPENPNHEIYLSVDEGGIQGFISLHWIPFPIIRGMECYISDLLVGSSFRGQGIGQTLIQKAEELAREKGCTRLMLNNRKEAPSYTRNFYKKQGFKEREVIANFVKMIDEDPL